MQTGPDRNAEEKTPESTTKENEYPRLIQELQNKNQQLIDENRSLNDMYNAKHNAAEKKIRESAVNLAEKVAENHSLDIEKRELSQDLSSARETIAALNEEKAKVGAKLRASEAENLVLNNTVADLEVEINRLKTGLNDSNEKLALLKESTAQTIRTQEAANEDLSKNLLDARATIASLHEQKAEVDGELQASKAENLKLKEASETLRLDYGELEAEVAYLSVDLQDAKEKLAALTQRIQDLEQVEKNMLRRIYDLQVELGTEYPAVPSLTYVYGARVAAQPQLGEQAELDIVRRLDSMRIFR